MRMRGHSEHDDFRYVPPDLLRAWQKWDPVARMQSYLRTRHGLDDDTVAGIDGEVAAAIDAAEVQAKAEPPPDPASARDGLYRRWSPSWTVPAGVLGGWQDDR